MGRCRSCHPSVPGHDAGHQVFAKAGGVGSVRAGLGGGTGNLSACARRGNLTPSCTRDLVEIGVGLLPGGGGCKEMLLRAVDGAAAARGKSSGEALAGSVEMMEAMKRAFETIATAKVATSAHEARGLGFLADSDRITMNRERVF